MRDRKRRDKKKTKQRARQRTKQRLRLKKKRLSLHDKHKKRRKKDCILGMPFIVAFTGDPSQLFYCADYPTSYELIPRTEQYPRYGKLFERLQRYMAHHVTQIHGKVLIYKAG